MNTPITPAAIKRWLKQIGEDRAWLAAQCGVSKSTIDGWLAENAERPISAPARRLLENLMNERLSVNPKISLNDFAKAQAQADKHGITVNEWIENCIHSSLKAAETPATYKTDSKP